jgi:hypothetical protein
MTALKLYLDQVAAENARMAIERPGDLRLAINAVMTLDGFFGALHSELYEENRITQKDDDKWKDTLACENKSYRLLRDCAYALKHGNLTKPKLRLVRRHDQIVTMPGGFSSAFDSGFQTEMVWIEATDTDYRADDIIKQVLQFARERICAQ